MGYFIVRRTLVVRGGSVDLGADANIYRSAANLLKTDDSVIVAGSATFGSPTVIQYGTTDTATAINGEIGIRHVIHVPGIVIRSGGTSYRLAFPTETHGTATFTVG